MTTSLIAVLITIGIIWWLLAPHFNREDHQSRMLKGTPVEVSRLDDERERYLRMLNDLELDYKTGKLGDDEYQILRQELVRDLGKILADLDRNLQTES